MKRFLSIQALLLLSVAVAAAQTPAQLKSWLPKIDGWTIADKVEVFTPENLFDRINGAAPLFIENNFREMTSMEYIKGDDRITIQAYRHATPEDTFGMYSSERSPEGLDFYPIGGEAQGDGMTLYFFAGDIYVKMWAITEEDVSAKLQQIAEGLAKNIDPDAGYPPIVRLFPGENKAAHTEAYITSSYIGHEFLRGVYKADYKIGGQAAQLFIVDAKTAEGAKEMLTKYFTFSRQPLDFKEGALVITDRFNGDIPVVWNGRYIVGVYSESGNAIQGTDALIKELAGKLPSPK